MFVTEHHARRMLRISNFPPERIEAVLGELSFPAELDDVIALFSRYGITTDGLIDSMGGSP